jgi:hypothetical protein
LIGESVPWHNVRARPRREYEILMRKVMALERQPAVMALYWWSPWHHRFFQSSQDEMDVIARCRHCSTMHADRESLEITFPASHDGEDSVAGCKTCPRSSRGLVLSKHSEISARTT